jgi:hypothetical protein
MYVCMYGVYDADYKAHWHGGLHRSDMCICMCVCMYGMYYAGI